MRGNNKYSAITEGRILCARVICVIVLVVALYFDLWVFGIVSGAGLLTTLILKKTKVDNATVDITLICQECNQEFNPTKEETETAIVENDKVFMQCPYCKKLAECKRKFF